ncbi:MAG: hypothetical protein KDC05_06255 [Bacteroidales bacterium]|nr:hypothetical protein [Bacteroidales bacterium]
MDLGQINQLLADYDGEIEGLLAGIPDEELVGAFRRNPRAMRKVIGRNRIIPQANSRHELAKRMSRLKSDVRGGLAKQQLQSVESGLFVIKSISNKQHVKMLQDSDNKETGYSMINGGKLEKGEPMLLSGITILYGLHATDPIEDSSKAAAAVWQPIPDVLRLGQFEFKGNGKTLIPWHTMEVFARNYTHVHADTVNGLGYAYALSSGSPVGFYKFDNPKLIETQTAMEFNLEWGANAAANSALYVCFHGSRVYKH